MWLKACLNGVRQRTDHPAVPETPGELRVAAERVAGTGVRALHLHPKQAADAEVLDSLEAPAVDAAVAGARAGAPGLAIGVTTGAWAMPELERRLSAIARWRVLPDFASVNWHESGAEQVGEALLARGIGVEAGLWTAESVDRWASSTVGSRCLRVLIELPDGLDAVETEAAADDLVARARRARPEVPILLHGAGTSCWPALRHAARLGLASRIGLEDTLCLPDGAVAADNLALVMAAYHEAQTVAGDVDGVRFSARADGR